MCRGDSTGEAGEIVDVTNASGGSDRIAGVDVAATMRAGTRGLMMLATLLVLEEQDRSLWHQPQIAEALPLVEEAFRAGPGPYAIQAGIAAMHCQAARFEDTDWAEILRLYDVLQRMDPSPIVTLNRAVALAMVAGPQAGLAVIDALSDGDLHGYHLLHAARADLLRRMGAFAPAAKSYEQALALVTNDSERRYLERRLREVSG